MLSSNFSGLEGPESRKLRVSWRLGRERTFWEVEVTGA